MPNEIPAVGETMPTMTTTTAPALPRIISDTTSNRIKGTHSDEVLLRSLDAPRWPSPSPAHLRRIILHFDINETILVGDDAGGDTREESLNKILAKSAFVRIDDVDDDDDDDDDDDNERENGGGDGRGAPSDHAAMKRNGARGSLTLNETKKLVPKCWWDGTPIGGGAEGVGSNGGEDSCGKHPAKTTTPAPLYTDWTWPPRSCPYYRTSYKRRAKSFTEDGNDGCAYRPLFDEMERRLSFADRAISTKSSSSYSSMSKGASESFIDERHPFHRMLPAFFRTLYELRRSKVDFAIVLRTFGSDLEDVAMAVSDFARGMHPSYQDFVAPELVIDRDGLYRGRWAKTRRKRDGGRVDAEERAESDDGGMNDNAEKDNVGYEATYELHRWDDQDYAVPYLRNDGGEGTVMISRGDVVASGDEDVLRIIEGRSAVGIHDDYWFWSKNGCDPRAGKPVWVVDGVIDHDGKIDNNGNDCGRGDGCHHIIFDDNIHNDPTDSIVAVRHCYRRFSRRLNVNEKNGGTSLFRSLDGEEIVSLHGRHLVRVPTIEPIVDEFWFLRRIADAVGIDLVYD